MTVQDDKSAICRVATLLVDVADLYDKAAGQVTDAERANTLRQCGERRRLLADELLVRAGVSGSPAASLLPTPDHVWLNVKSLFSGGDGAALGSVRSADEMLMVALQDYIHHAQPSSSAAAATWLHEELQREIGSPEDRSSAEKAP